MFNRGGHSPRLKKRKGATRGRLMKGGKVSRRNSGKDPTFSKRGRLGALQDRGKERDRGKAHIQKERNLNHISEELEAWGSSRSSRGERLRATFKRSGAKSK